MSDNNISTEVKAFAEAIRKEAEIDTKGAVKFGKLDDAVAEHLLPEGMTMDQVKQTQQVLINAVAGVNLAGGEAGIEMMSENKDLQRVKSSGSVGYSKVETAINRLQSGETNGHKWEKYGGTKATLTIGVGSKSRPSKAVEEHLKEKAKSVFAN